LVVKKGCDGVVFVGDSQAARMEANVKSLKNLELNLKEQGYDLKTIAKMVLMELRKGR